MADDQEDQPQAEYSTPAVDLAKGQDWTALVTACRFCEAAFSQPVPKGKQTLKQFCCNAHRAAYREREKQRAIRMALDAIDSTQAEMERSAAVLNGARQVLERFEQKKKKTT